MKKELLTPIAASPRQDHQLFLVLHRFISVSHVAPYRVLAESRQPVRDFSRADPVLE